jgi:mono/diheme cytochrome c family protein
MHTRNELGKRGRAGLRLGAAAAAILAIATMVAMADDSAPSKPSKPPKKAEAKVKKLSGSDLYQIHCSRCHAERYATERTTKEWKTLMLHMRVRANLPADQAKAVLKYLQEDSGK